MTAHLHLMGDSEKASISANGYARKDVEEPFFALRIAQNIAGSDSNEVIIFADFKDREEFAERIYEAIMAMPTPNVQEVEGGQAQ